MPANVLKISIAALVLLLLAFMLWSSLSHAGVQELEGDFEEIAFYRNENNTGPIVRLYAVSLADTLWQQMQQYGDFMPYTKYGTTKVFFFLKNAPLPQGLKPGKDNLEEQDKPFCIGLYEKSSMGQVRFVRFPFRQN